MKQLIFYFLACPCIILTAQNQEAEDLSQLLYQSEINRIQEDLKLMVFEEKSNDYFF